MIHDIFLYDMYANTFLESLMIRALPCGLHEFEIPCIPMEFAVNKARPHQQTLEKKQAESSNIHF